MQDIKIATWNVNSIRTRLPILIEWVREENPDIILLQELKCTNEQFPREELSNLGFNLAIHGQKTYNGVAILSRFPIEDVTNTLADITDSRYIEAVISLENNVIRVASVYVPNGSEVGSEKYIYKLKFMDHLYGHLKELLKFEEIMIIGGDFNIAPENIDLYDHNKLQDSLCFTIEERNKYRKIMNLGFIDSYRALYPEKQEFTWWDYRAGSWQKNHGMRIDYHLCSPEAADLIIATEMSTKLRNMEKASDHVPVVTTLKIESNCGNRAC